jgi:hypothetical protein
VKKLVLVPLALVTALTLMGCETEEKPAAKADTGTSAVDDTADNTADHTADETSDDVGTDVVVEEPSEEPVVEEETPGTATLGDLMTLGDWDVKVTEVLVNAEATIHKANQFNDKPKGTYVLVTYEATYNGSERTADAWMDLTWSFTGTDGQVNDTASAVTPADDQSWPTEARTGGTIKGQEVFDINPALIHGGLLTVEAYDANFDTVYADFLVP